MKCRISTHKKQFLKITNYSVLFTLCDEKHAKDELAIKVCKKEEIGLQAEKLVKFCLNNHQKGLILWYEIFAKMLLYRYFELSVRSAQ